MLCRRRGAHPPNQTAFLPKLTKRQPRLPKRFTIDHNDSSDVGRDRVERMPGRGSMGAKHARVHESQAAVPGASSHRNDFSQAQTPGQCPGSPSGERADRVPTPSLGQTHIAPQEKRSWGHAPEESCHAPAAATGQSPGSCGAAPAAGLPKDSQGMAPVSMSHTNVPPVPVKALMCATHQLPPSSEGCEPLPGATDEELDDSRPIMTASFPAEVVDDRCAS